MEVVKYMISLLEAINELKITACDPEARHLITGITWEQYLDFTNLTDNRGYRINYLEGVLEIMSPSRDHEIIRGNIGRLLEIYFEETQTPFWGLGSTTFSKKDNQAAK